MISPQPPPAATNLSNQEQQEQGSYHRQRQDEYKENIKIFILSQIDRGNGTRGPPAAIDNRPRTAQVQSSSRVSPNPRHSGEDLHQQLPADVIDGFDSSTIDQLKRIIIPAEKG